MHGVHGRRGTFLDLSNCPFAYVSGLYLSLLLIFQVADPAEVLGAWTGSSLYLIIGSYVIASALRRSGLGERIAHLMLLKLVRSYQGLIIAIFSRTLR